MTGMGTVVLSRRNLLSLLDMLDNPSGIGPAAIRNNDVYVSAEEDDVHYGERVPGLMDPDVEERLARLS